MTPGAFATWCWEPYGTEAVGAALVSWNQIIRTVPPSWWSSKLQPFQVPPTALQGEARRGHFPYRGMA
jgi:hypothetical protein